ncbi:hypothetical protein ACIBKY_07105 [Nonomuraea sp. NPDC050394]
MDLINAQWRKAHRSAGNGGNRVAVAVMDVGKEGRTPRLRHARQQEP